MVENTIGDPSLPEGPIRILGQPWTIEVCEVPDPDDPEFISRRFEERRLIRIAESLPPHGQAYQLWVHLWWGIYGPMVWGSGEPEDKQGENTVLRTMWAVLNDNAVALASWFGWVTGEPFVRDGPIRVLGQPWQLKLVHRIPRNPVSVYGLESNPDWTLYVRSDLAPSFTAEVALHELCHAAVRPVSPVGGDEAFIRPMAAGLAQVFYDNPQAMITLFGIQSTETAV